MSVDTTCGTKRPGGQGFSSAAQQPENKALAAGALGSEQELTTQIPRGAECASSSKFQLIIRASR